MSVMLLSIGINYVAGILIANTRKSSAGSVCLAVAVALNLAILFVYKYSNFIVDNVNAILLTAGIPGIVVDPVHLPIGISFFTFQAISYVVDIYRDDADVQRNPINASLYIALFPQLIAGPIVRYQSIAKQLVSRSVTVDQFYAGTVLFIIGLGKKMLIANPMGEIADQIFALETQYLDLGLSWLAVLAYTLQIYFDFSGYSDMALGIGLMLGFTFPINFNHPYIALSMREFWQRWHITLSRWFRDYVYVPLGGNRHSPARVYVNLLIVFVLCGLWHGASWNFVIWGLCHGLFLTLERTAWGEFIATLWKPLRWFYVMLIVVTTWVFFRSESLDQAGAFLQAMVGVGQGDGVAHYAGFYINTEKWIVLLVGIVAATPTFSYARRFIESRLPSAVIVMQGAQCVGLLLIMFVCYMHLAVGTHNPFIYFRF